MKRYRILYSSYSKIPSETANSIAVLKQCSALNNYSELKAVLIKGNYKQDYERIYNVHNLNLTLLPKHHAKFCSFGLSIRVTLYALIFKPDVVYSRDVFINRVLNVFHITNYYEMHQLDQCENKFDKQYKKALKSVATNHYTKRIICIANTLKKECLNFGLPESKLTVLHSGVDLNDGVSTDKDSLKTPFFKNKKPLAVYTGSTLPGKGTDVIIQMAKITNDYNFLIVGGAKGDIPETENLKHIPWVSQSLINNYLSMADYLLMPTTLQKYKFHSPLKLFEYLKSGKVIIASDIDCVKEIIIHGVNGMLAKMGDAQSFIEQLNIVNNNSFLANQIKQNARLCVKEYSWENRAKKIISYINEDIK